MLLFIYFVFLWRVLKQAVGRILVSDATVQNVGFKNPTYDYDAARE